MGSPVQAAHFRAHPTLGASTLARWHAGRPKKEISVKCRPAQKNAQVQVAPIRQAPWLAALARATKTLPGHAHKCSWQCLQLHIKVSGHFANFWCAPTSFCGRVSGVLLAFVLRMRADCLLDDAGVRGRRPRLENFAILGSWCPKIWAHFGWTTLGPLWAHLWAHFGWSNHASSVQSAQLCELHQPSTNGGGRFMIFLRTLK